MLKRLNIQLGWTTATVIALAVLPFMAACSGTTPAPETLSPTSTPEPAATLTPYETPALTEETTSGPTPAIIHRATTRPIGTATLAITPTAIPTPTPTRVIPPTPRPPQAFPTATATPAPFASLEVDIDRETRWRDLLDHLYPHERSCIEAEGEPDRLDMPILPDFPYPLDHEAAVFACLEPGTARPVLLGATIAAFQQDGDFRIPEDEVACIRNMLTGMDAAAAVAAMAIGADDRLPAGEFMAGFFRCIPKAWAYFGVWGEPEDIQERIDCARNALAGANAEIMVALIWTEEETPEAERFLETLTGCISALDERGDIQDDHADRIEDATVVEVEHTLIAAVDYDYDVDFFAFVAEEGTIYQIGVGLGTLEEVTISLHGPFPEYDELYTAGSRQNGRTTSLHWQSPYTDMVFVAVYGEGGTGGYSFFVNAVNLGDDHANIRGKGTALAVGQEAWGELEFHGDVDAFRLDAEEGTVYAVTVDLRTWEDVSLRVEDIYGNLVASAAVGFSGKKGRASAVWKAETPGFHYILVQGPSTGTYSLSARAWQDDHGDSSETATALAVGEYVKSRIDTGQDIDYFVFEAQEGTFYLIESELGDLLFISLSLLDRRGEIASDDNHLGDQPARIHWEAPAAGEYWIAVEGRDTGTYGIVVWSRVQPER